MLKKFIIASLVATTLVPVTGALAAEGTANAAVPADSVAAKSDSIRIMTSTYEINADGVRLRASASSSGTVLGLLYKGDMVNGGSETKRVDGITWVSVYSYNHGVWGWVASQYLTEIG
ncbi:SH3 domain-containing protein [Paenibacillus oralis]|uniref:SH3 domain-containing protein n=1 Tax=Paenibacillus oralis TaxID=2490856 RepID=A0A3P3U517_9BACL|nr:SH3 domain-containing protein [Paenibacillus oralis]RRJ65270.1 SH3 domain-containing protein [Paenibacillus oralis]